MCRSLELAIATARALELNMKGYELDRRNLLSESLEASRTEMLTWQQADVILQALEASVIALARRPLIGTKVERLPRRVRSLNPSSRARRQLTMRNSCEAAPRVGLNVRTARTGVGPLQRAQNQPAATAAHGRLLEARQVAKQVLPR